MVTLPVDLSTSGNGVTSLGKQRTKSDTKMADINQFSINGIARFSERS